jgi:hypothetical protein
MGKHGASRLPATLSGRLRQPQQQEAHRHGNEASATGIDAVPRLKHDQELSRPGRSGFEKSVDRRLDGARSQRDEEVPSTCRHGGSSKCGQGDSEYPGNP